MLSQCSIHLIRKYLYQEINIYILGNVTICTNSLTQKYNIGTGLNKSHKFGKLFHNVFDVSFILNNPLYPIYVVL